MKIRENTRCGIADQVTYFDIDIFWDDPLSHVAAEKIHQIVNDPWTDIHDTSKSNYASKIKHYIPDSGPGSQQNRAWVWRWLDQERREPRRGSQKHKQYTGYQGRDLCSTLYHPICPISKILRIFSKRWILKMNNFVRIFNTGICRGQQTNFKTCMFLMHILG